MNYMLITLTILLLTDTCGPVGHRSIQNYTMYGVEIINYANVPPIGADTFSYIKPFGELSVTAPDEIIGYFNVPPFTPEQTDSLIINFYQEGSDTVYHKVFKQYDTTLLFRCLTGSEPPTCTIEERHLEGATLIVK